MPAADPEDQQAARAIETALREAVQRSEQPPIELDWFLALPKRIRRSGKLIEVAQAEARLLLEHARHTWAKERKAEAIREVRLAELRAQPRDLGCLRSPDSSGGAWQGIGRRKKRCRTFNAVGRAFNARKQVRFSDPPVTAPKMTRSATVDIMMTDPYITTPPALRESVEQLIMSVRKVPPYSVNQTWEAFSPNPEYMPLPIPEPPERSPTPEYPTSLLPGELSRMSGNIDPVLAWIVARGRHARAPYSDCSLGEAATCISMAETSAPGLLGSLISLLFVDGLDCAMDCIGLEAVVDLCAGWEDIQLRDIDGFRIS